MYKTKKHFFVFTFERVIYLANWLKGVAYGEKSYKSLKSIVRSCKICIDLKDFCPRKGALKVIGHDSLNRLFRTQGLELVRMARPRGSTKSEIRKIRTAKRFGNYGSI